MSELRFEVIGARHEPYAVVPTLILRLRISEDSGQQIGTIALRAQIQIEPRRRRYDGAEEDRLLEVFGEPARWGDTLRTLLWTNASLVVPAFSGSTEVDLPIACTYDFEVVAAKYFHSLDGGEIPLLFLFSGTVFERRGTGFSIDQVPWHHEAAYRLPVSVWRAMMDAYFPDSAWIRLRRDTFDALHQYRGRRVLTTWDEAVDSLLDAVSEPDPV